METDRTLRSCILFLTFVVAVYCLYVLRDILAPFALAIFVWLIIDAFARWIDSLSPRIPYWPALIIAVLTVFLGLAGVVWIIADTGFAIAEDAPRYQARIQEIFQWVGGLTGQDLSYNAMNERFGLTDKLQTGLLGFASSIQSVLSNFMVIAIYVAFLFAAQSTFSGKLDDLFPEADKRLRAGRVMESIRHSVEKYVSVQTIMSLIQTVLSYFVMAAVGLDNALFWAFVIFILNYIPIIGGVVAVVMPLLFGLIQFESIPHIAALAAGLILVQVVLNNTLQPKMMGDSMNMSPLVVILTVALWGALWGGVGMFLSAPLTVIIMIILAQFPTTRWIAVLLSADGRPDDEDEPEEISSQPSL